MKKTQILLISLCLFFIYLMSVGVRFGIRQEVELKYANPPFTMEGAYLYYFSKQIVQGHHPIIDFKAQNPEGINPDAKLSLTPDYILGFLYRSFFSKIPYDVFLRVAQNFVLPLGIFVVFGVCLVLSGSPMTGIWASLLYGISFHSVLRSTGIEYSRENFALPILFLHFFLLLGKKNVFKDIAASLTLALALAVWDGSQTYFILWILYELLHFLFKSDPDSSPTIIIHRSLYTKYSYLSIHLLILIPLALMHPYLKDHQFLYSPGMLGLYILGLTTLFQKRTARLLTLILIPIVFFLWLSSPYIQIYQHMIELAVYKIKFLNIKPQDPSLIPFDVRLLWTPALHSALLNNIKSWIPLIALGFAAMIAFRKKITRDVFFLLFFCAAFFILFLAFVRFEVFLIFFLACLIGSIPFGNLQRNRQKIFWNSCIILVLLFEAIHLTRDFSRFERPVPYSCIEGVTEWVRENTPKDSIILSNFGLSPSFLAYSSRGIILQPKYESGDMREKIKDFALTLFENREEPFYRFCLMNEAHYYVHAVGTFQDRSLYSWRYMANQMVPIGEPLASKFEYKKPLQYFSQVYTNGKYRVYRILWPQEIRRAKILRNEGDSLFEMGSLGEAENCYQKALKLNPCDFMLYFRLSKLYKKAGFQGKAVAATKEGLKRVSK